MEHKFIRCENGSFLLIRNITRLFVETDNIKKTAAIKASTVGPALPFTVATYDNTNQADTGLYMMVNWIEGNAPDGNHSSPEQG